MNNLHLSEGASILHGLVRVSYDLVWGAEKFTQFSHTCQTLVFQIPCEDRCLDLLRRPSGVPNTSSLGIWKILED